MIRAAFALLVVMPLAACEPAPPARQPENPATASPGVRVSGTARAGISVSLRNAIDPVARSGYDPVR